MEGDSISVTLVADAITTCLRNFTVSVTSRDGSATSEGHATYYSQTTQSVAMPMFKLHDLYLVALLHTHHCVNYVVKYFTFMCLTIFHASIILQVVSITVLLRDQ